jgi:N-acetylneuraminic acid mutarotase
MVYDPGSDRAILFGGLNDYSGEQFEDTWVFYPDTNTWTELHPDPHPSKRGWYAAAYSTKAEQVILFGGGRNTNRFTDETWIYDPATNTWTDVSLSP